MDAIRIDQLTARQKDCLRLYHRRLTAKEIGCELGLTENTVNRYLTLASATLDAGGREAAASLLARHEGTYQDPVYRIPAGDPPATVPPTPVPDEAEIEPTPNWRGQLPLRRKGAVGNDLSVAVRLAWIPGIALAGAIGFGSAAAGARIVSDIVRSFLR